MKYRPEIDGLRAVAVIPVILFHAGFEFVSGGFVGVDIFFVISGYLITTIILSEMERGTFSIVNFYERRARRILPALFLVMFVSLPFAWLWLLPADLKNFSQALVAVSTFSSNILFWFEINYWSPAGELNPLLHTWSLAVEEQYYVLFPLFLMLMWRYGKRWILTSFIVATVISLAAAEWGSSNAPIATFYLLPTRAWELAIGAGIAFYFLYRKQEIRTLLSHRSVDEAFSLLGLLMIVYAIFVFDAYTPFPGLYALVPTIGTGLIILFSSSKTIVGRLLATKPFVAIGLISYSAYLWHQPLFAFARHRNLVDLNQPTFAILTLLSLLFAYLSWRYIEKPFRTKGIFSRKQIFTFAAIGSAFFIVIGLSGHLNKGWVDRAEERFLVSDSRDYCSKDEFNADKICSIVDRKDKLTILMGDSHAGTLSRGMEAIFEKNHAGLIQLSKVDCLPIENVYRADHGPIEKLDTDSCYHFNKKMYDYIESNKEIKNIILSARWTSTMEGSLFNNQEGGIETKGYTPHLDLVINGEPKYHPDYGHRSQIAEAIKKSIHRLLDMGKNVILIYPIPEAGWNVPYYLYKYQMINSAIDIPAKVASTSYDIFKERNKRSYNALDEVGEHPNLFRVYPEKYFCDRAEKERCVVHNNGIPYYRDSNHLSNAGSKIIAEEVVKYLK